MTLPILVVDDSLTVRMNLSEMLETAGLAVVACETGAEARQALKEGEFSLVILDVLLPDADGIDLLKEIRENAEICTLPIMLLSSEAEVRDRIRGLETGADEYIGKPYDPSYLTARARELARNGQPQTTGGDTVLVIDDSLTFREALREALEGASYRVMVAATGEEGLRLAAQVRPLAILVDRVLPGIDGTAVVRQVRFDAALRRVPCLLLTSSEEREAEISALEAGADAFVRKDEDIGIILARFRAMLRSAGEQVGDHAAATLLTTKRILTVDDSEVFLQETAEMLRTEGYDVALARSGEEAIALLKVQPVDCVLLDIMMPGIGGEEACRQLKSMPETRDIPVIMLTGIEDRAAMIRGLDAGADDFIAKSSDLSVLRARLAAQLRRRQFEDENRQRRLQLQRKEIEAAESRAARELAEARAQMVDELEAKVAQRTEELRNSQQRFRDIAEISGDWLWETNAEHRFIYVGGETENLNGYETAKVLGKTFWELFEADPTEGKWRLNKSDLDNHRPFRNFRCSVVGLDNRTSHFSISGKPVFGSDGTFAGYRGTIANQTAISLALSRTRAAEAELRDALTRLDAAFDASPAAIVALDVEDKVLLWNRAAHKIYGWSEQEAVGRTFTMEPDEERERSLDLFRRVMQGESISDVEGVHLTKNGQRIDVMIAAAPLPDVDGQPRGALYVINDVTDRLSMENQLRQSQKMEAVGQLTGGVAHDFNNILLVILSNVEELLENPDLSDEQRDLLTGVSTSGQRAAEMTRRLLAFSRKQRLAPQPTNLAELVAGVDKLLRRTLGEQIQIDTIFGENLWTASVDQSQVEAALVNLCVNARDAMPEGGRLLIETSNAELDDEYASANAGVKAGPYVVLAVSDTGTGMAPEVLTKVFEPFFTTKGVGKGTGLGLSMVYGFVKQSNGHISIYSEVGRGTIIRLYLPRSDAPAADRTQVTLSMPGGSERVLLVEDQKDVRESVLRQLRSLGYDVVEASGGQNAVDLLEKHAAFDLMVTDVIMPGMDGCGLAQIVYERWPHIRVLFVSGYSDNAIKLHGILGADAQILSKPFRKADLAMRVRASLDL